MALSDLDDSPSFSNALNLRSAALHWGERFHEALWASEGGDESAGIRAQALATYAAGLHIAAAIERGAYDAKEARES